MLHADEEQALVGSVAIEAGAAEESSRGNVFFRPKHLSHLAVDRQGLLIRHPIGRLHKTDGVALVFDRYEATGDTGEGKASEQDACRQCRHHDRTGLQHRIQDGGIALLKTAVEAVEIVEDDRNEVAHHQTDGGEQHHWNRVAEDHPGGDHTHCSATGGEGKTQRQACDLAGNEADHGTDHGGDQRSCGPITRTEQAVDEAKNNARCGVLIAAELLGFTREQQGRQHRREGEGVEGGDADRKKDRGGELLVDRAGGTREEQHRQEHGHLHQGGGDHSAEQFIHGFHGRLHRRHPLGLFGGGVFHHGDGVVHHQTGGQHQAKQGELVERETEGQHQGKGSDEGHRNGNGRNQGGFPVLQEQEQDQHHQDHGIPQGIGHTLDRLVDEVRGVVDLLNTEAHRKGCLEFLEHILHTVGHLDGVTARELIDGDTNGRGAFEVHGIDAIGLTAKLHTAHILQTH